MYEIRHTCDELGGRIEAAQGSLAGVTDSLEEAIDTAEALMAKGCCGFVRRASDGMILAPDGDWI